MTLPTIPEIIARIAERRAQDIFGFETFDYVQYLPFEDAKPLLVENAAPEKWTQLPLTREAVLKQMHDYMDFAWGKANGQRGLSAGRSISHYTAWTWLAGDRELSEWTDSEENYFHYGKPILQHICEHYGWDWKQWDDGVRNNGE